MKNKLNEKLMVKEQQQQNNNNNKINYTVIIL